jgi:hypothetical protein
VARPRGRTGDADTDTTTSRPGRTRGGRGATSVADAQNTTTTEMHLGRPPGARGGTPPRLALPPPSTTRTLNQVRNTRDRRERARRAEEYAREQYGGTGGERHYPVATNTDPDFPVTTPGGRKVDVAVDLPNGRTLAVEVKMYQQYRTVTLPDGTRVAERVEVPLSSHIREQVNKDVALRRADPNYDPRWVFYGAGPNQALRDHLNRAGIVFVEHN